MTRPGNVRPAGAPPPAVARVPAAGRPALARGLAPDELLEQRRLTRRLPYTTRSWGRRSVQRPSSYRSSASRSMKAMPPSDVYSGVVRSRVDARQAPISVTRPRPPRPARQPTRPDRARRPRRLGGSMMAAPPAPSLGSAPPPTHLAIAFMAAHHNSPLSNLRMLFPLRAVPASSLPSEPAHHLHAGTASQFTMPPVGCREPSDHRTPLPFPRARRHSLGPWAVLAPEILALTTLASCRARRVLSLDPPRPTIIRCPVLEGSGSKLCPNPLPAAHAPVAATQLGARLHPPADR